MNHKVIPKTYQEDSMETREEIGQDKYEKMYHETYVQDLIKQIDQLSKNEAPLLKKKKTMSKKEWKEFYRVIETNEIGQYLNTLFANLENYDEAVKIGKEKYKFFKVGQYFKQVEVEIVYEYLVVFKNNHGWHTVDNYAHYTSKEEFEKHHNWEFVELVQATKRERK